MQFGQEVHAKMPEKREQAYCSGFAKVMGTMITQRLFRGRSSAQQQVHVTHILHHAFLCFAMAYPTRYTFAVMVLYRLSVFFFLKSVTACGVVWLWLLSAAQRKIAARVQPLFPRGRLALPLPSVWHRLGRSEEDVSGIRGAAEAMEISTNMAAAACALYREKKRE